MLPIVNILLIFSKKEPPKTENEVEFEDESLPN
jgi:hypothetical protein